LGTAPLPATLPLSHFRRAPRAQTVARENNSALERAEKSALARILVSVRYFLSFDIVSKEYHCFVEHASVGYV
jgi:hypothetical protein